MLKKLAPIVLAISLLITGCTKNSPKTEENLNYSNLLDSTTQEEVKNILIENNINKSQADYFIELVKNYNEKSNLEKLKTSFPGFKKIDSTQVPYDEGTLGEIWDYNELNYVDFNCRLTAFVLYKDFIKSDSKFTGDDINLMFDADTIENNPMSKFTAEDADKFTNIYAAIPVKNTEDVDKLSQAIIKEWKNRKISFDKNTNVSMINVFLHSPEDSNVFVGHSGILVNTKDGVMFIEKYGPSLPYQVSKFENKEQVKAYLMDRLDVNTADNGAAKPIIMENDEVL